jgi:hypothetical protein
MSTAAVSDETWGLEKTAEFLRIHKDTLAERARAGEIPGAKIGRAWVFMPELLKDRSKWRAPKRAARRLTFKALLAATEKISAHANLVDDFYQQLLLPLRLSSGAHAGKRKKVIRRATPVWADLNAIERMYSAARTKTLETGIAHTVDHVIPLQGATVCGLHIHQNMRVVTGSENSQKYNKWGFAQ